MDQHQGTEHSSDSEASFFQSVRFRSFCFSPFDFGRITAVPDYMHLSVAKTHDLMTFFSSQFLSSQNLSQFFFSEVYNGKQYFKIKELTERSKNVH